MQVVCHIVIKEKHSNKQAIIKPRLKTVAFMVILCANIFQCVCFQRTIKVKTSPCLLNLKPIYQISIWLLMMYICMFCRNYVYTIQISKIQFCFAAHLQVNKANVYICWMQLLTCYLRGTVHVITELGCIEEPCSPFKNRFPYKTTYKKKSINV